MANIGSVGADGVGIQDWREALQGAVKSWKAISKSEEFDALMASALGALQGVAKSWQEMSKSEEFTALMASALDGFQGVLESWEPMSRSEDFRALKASVLPAGGDMMKQARGSLVQAVSALLADRAVLRSWAEISQTEEFKSLMTTALPAGRAMMQRGLQQAKGPLFQEMVSLLADRAGGLLGGPGLRAAG